MGRAPEPSAYLAWPSPIGATGAAERAGRLEPSLGESHGHSYLHLHPPSPAPWTVGEATPIYRPRHPERTGFYRIFERHFEEYVGTYEERFEHRSGPLRPAVNRAVEAYLDCGRLFCGFARIRCGSCGSEHLLAFSCQTRNFCPSCQAKRAALFAEKLTEEIALPVVHRHLVFTIPKALRGLFQRERRLLGLLSRCAYEAVRRAYGAYLENRTVVPGFASSIQTFGSFAANFHPHIHALVTQGSFTREGEFVAVGTVNTGVIEEIFRRLVLTRLTRAERLSEEFRDNLLSWVHSGFSVHAGPRIYPTDPEYLARLGRYIVRVPMPSKDVRLTSEGQVRVTTPPDPRTGKTQLTLDPLDWIHAVVQQIPAPRQHMARYYGAYSNRKRKAIESAGKEEEGVTLGGSGCGQGADAPEGEDGYRRPRASSRAAATQNLRDRSALMSQMRNRNEGRQRDHGARGGRQDPATHRTHRRTGPVRGPRATRGSCRPGGGDRVRGIPRGAGSYRISGYAERII